MLLDILQEPAGKFLGGALTHKHECCSDMMMGTQHR